LVAIEYRVAVAMKNVDSEGFLFGARDAVIFDEAHQLESKFENAWTDDVSIKKLKSTFDHIDSLVSPYEEDGVSYNPALGKRVFDILLRLKSKSKFRADGLSIFGKDAVEAHGEELVKLGHVIEGIRGGYLGY